MEKVKNHLKSLYEQRKKFIEEANYIKAEEITQKIKEPKIELRNLGHDTVLKKLL